MYGNRDLDAVKKHDYDESIKAMKDTDALIKRVFVLEALRDLCLVRQTLLTGNREGARAGSRLKQESTTSLRRLGLMTSLIA
ncbi:bacterioferritin [Caballeronia hypogeia]|uniref:Bacterioferritin n=1 Tax=Caballeronia hypogeia TaxID=1777140 RepID=A0A158DRG2_9BURK|nr:bacterioferritin [Caballeronia hypogeia]